MCCVLVVYYSRYILNVVLFLQLKSLFVLFKSCLSFFVLFFVNPSYTALFLLINLKTTYNTQTKHVSFTHKNSLGNNTFAFPKLFLAINYVVL